jgi:hypothetical protein
MQEIVWNDGLLPGRRRPRLWLIKDGIEAKKFDGVNIEGFCLIKTETFKKNGNYSNTTYKIALFPGVRALELCSPLHNHWGHQYESWLDASNDLGLSIDMTKRIVTEEYPYTAERISHIEAVMELVEETKESEVKVVNVMRKDEFIKVQTSYGPVILKPGIGPGEFVSWSTPSIEGKGVKLIDVKESGHRRHTVYTIRLAILPD